MDRRQVLKGAAWSAPIIAVAAAAPMAAASTPQCESNYYEYDPRTNPVNGGAQNNAAKITVVTGSHVQVEYLRDIGHPHVNLRVNGKTTNYHYARQVKAGEVFTFPFEECQDAEWIQVAGNNVHYYGGGVFH